MRRPGIVAAATAGADARRRRSGAVGPLELGQRQPRDPHLAERARRRRRRRPAVPGRRHATADRRDRRAAVERSRRRRGRPDVSRTLPGITGAATPAYLGASTWTIQAQLSGDQTGTRAQRDVKLIREIDAPFPIHVTGQAAEFVDQQARDRVRSAAGARAAGAADVRGAVADDRLGRAADQGDRDEPADGRRGADLGRRDLPAWQPHRRARLHPGRRRRDELVRGRGRARVRVVDRLRRVSARADQGAAGRGRRRP